MAALSPADQVVRNGLSRLSRVFSTAAAILLLAGVALGQEVYSDQRPRILLDGEFGSESALGYKFPSISMGPAVEIPIAKRFEVQANAYYSPDRKKITDDGTLAAVNGSLLMFVNQRFGFTGSLEQSWLWTSQFNKSALYPSAGVVVRNDYIGHGRLYVSYVFPTGCAAATAADPCTIQSSRLQGVKVRQEMRTFSRARWGVESGLYHYCNEGNPQEAQLGRDCRWGATALVLLRFEFHARRSNSRFTSLNAIESDNF